MLISVYGMFSHLNNPCGFPSNYVRRIGALVANDVAMWRGEGGKRVLFIAKCIYLVWTSLTDPTRTSYLHVFEDPRTIVPGVVDPKGDGGMLDATDETWVAE